MTYLIIGLYFICSYFLTRFAHKHIEPLPNDFIGIISILFLPLPIIICCTGLLKGKNLTNKIFGEPVKGDK